jgi:tetratricopeptide (TPR) repeat protein
LADFDKAVAMKPGYALALANRGLIRAQRQENEAATRDLDAALAIEPRQAVAWRGRGVVAQTLGKNDDAIADYTTSLQIDPGNSFAIGHRAEAEAAKGQVEAALADAAAALKDDPSWGALYLLRANLFRRTGKADLVQKEADTAAAAAPTNVYVLTMAAKIYASYGRRADAMAMFDRSLAVHPTALTYSNRAETRLKSDVAGRLADLDAAIKLDPEWAEPLIAKAELEVEQKHPAEAAAALAATMRLNTDDAIELGRRAIVYQQIGDRVHAQADFAAARKKATTASDLNGLCWQKATAGVDLDVALAECDAALALTPGSAAVIDSRALVLLRMNRIEDAVGAYDKALAQYPDMPSSLYGRAVAEARKGDKQASDRDRAAALKVDPEVGHEFATYGVDIGQKSPSL